MKRRILFVLLSIPCTGCNWVLKEFPEVPYQIDLKPGDRLDIEMPNQVIDGKTPYERCADLGGNLDAIVYVDDKVICPSTDF